MLYVKPIMKAKAPAFLVPHCFLWTGVILAASIIVGTPGDHWIIVPILIASAITSLSILAYQLKACSGLEPESPKNNPDNANQVRQ